MDWTDQDIALVRLLWAEGLSTAEIGRRVGNRGKNAIIGKVHRLKLPARPSPIQAAGSGKRKPSARRFRGPSLPALQRITTENDKGGNFGDPIGFIDPQRVDRANGYSAEPEVTVPLVGVTFRPRRVSPCCWPIGEPGRSGYRTCDEPSLAGKSYCDGHDRIAHVKVRDRREDGVLYPAPGSLDAR